MHPLPACLCTPLRAGLLIAAEPAAAAPAAAAGGGRDPGADARLAQMRAFAQQTQLELEKKLQVTNRVHMWRMSVTSVMHASGHLCGYSVIVGAGPEGWLGQALVKPH